MSHREGAGSRPLPDLGGQAQQTLVVGHRRPVFADGLGNLLPGHPEGVRQPPVGARFLDRVQVLSLNILDQRQLEPLLVGDRPSQPQGLS